MPEDRLNNSLRSPEKVAAICEAYRQELGYTPDQKFDILTLVELDLYDRIENYKFQVCYDSDMRDFAEVEFDPPRLRVRESIYKLAVNNDAQARYWIAHEVGHLLLHSKFVGMKMQKSARKYSKSIRNQNAMRGVEAQADVFARFLLLSVLNQHVRTQPEATVKDIYGVPLSQVRAHRTQTKRVDFVDQTAITAAKSKLSTAAR